MDPWQILLAFSAIIAAFLQSVTAIKCYNCVSTTAGCGRDVNIRLQRQRSCAEPPTGGGENFCVKVIERRGGEEIILRDCLMTLRQESLHRARMPTVQRHGYCSPARNNDPYNPYNEDIIYCFCNDWNGCNPASGLKAKYTGTILFAATVWLISRYLL